MQTTPVGRGTTSAVRMLARQAIRRTVACAVIGMATLALPACNDQNTDANDGIGAAIELPRGLGSARAIEQERLILEASVGSQQLQFSRSGQTHRGRFKLSDNRTYDLNVRFSYRASGRSEPITIAAIDPRPISLALAARTIRVTQDDYNYNFDEDGDFIYNIDEIREGTDPFVAETPRIHSESPFDVRPFDVTPVDPRLVVMSPLNSGLENIDLTEYLSDDQGDCRLSEVPLPDASAGFAGAAGADSASGSSADSVSGSGLLASHDVQPAATHDIHQLTLDTVDSFALQLSDGQKRYQAAFILAESGRLSIEQSGGMPHDTRAVIYDRPAVSTDAAGARHVARIVASSMQPASATPDGKAARLSNLDLAAGLYCLVLYAEGEDSAQATDLSDLVLTVSHLAN